jgi:site-specific recombinase XerC
LNDDDIVRFLEAVPSLKTRTALTTAYAAGLRASETVHLKVSNINGERGVIRVEHGKGGKDRNVMLSAQLLSILRFTGSWHDRNSGYFQAGKEPNPSTLRFCIRPVVLRVSPPASTNG